MERDDLAFQNEITRTEVMTSNFVAQYVMTPNFVVRHVMTSNFVVNTL